MTLRARLVAGLIVVSAAGLLLLGGITYAEQRSFLLERVDDQARAAPGAVGRVLEEKGINVPGYGHAEPERGPGGRRGGGPPRDSFNLPPGTYGERRDASGKSLGGVVLGFEDVDLPKPVIPRDLPVGRLRTVGSEGDSGLRYRVLAEKTPGQPGTTVVAVPLSDVDGTLDRLLLVESVVIGGVLLVLGGLGLVLVRIGLRPLDRMGETARAIAAGDLGRRVSPATQRTEVGRLGLALNAMLDRLERAFAQREASEERLRRFIADASHELRTPLSSIRGYAELYRMGAASSPEDLEKAMARIEDEAARMGVLVEDLLILARLDEVRDAQRAPVDLAVLAADAAADARATDPSRELDVRDEGDEGDGVVLGDEHQLRQVLANLLRNALVHTPAGTPVEIAVRAGDTEVEVEVRDHGPGLPGDDPDALFDRFWRAEGGRVRGQAGAGLGLAIVAGIVGAHGGRVHAANAPDGGARFTVVLPAAAQGSPGLLSPAGSTVPRTDQRRG